MPGKLSGHATFAVFDACYHFLVSCEVNQIRLRLASVMEGSQEEANMELHLLSLALAYLVPQSLRVIMFSGLFLLLSVNLKEWAPRTLSPSIITAIHV